MSSSDTAPLIPKKVPLQEQINKLEKRVIWTFVAFALAIVGAYVVGALLPPNRGSDINALQILTSNLTNQLQQSNLQIDMLRSDLVEIMVEAGNATLLQNGTFIWGVSRSQDNLFPFATCTTGQSAPGFNLVSAGTGYRVGDLVTLHLDDPLGVVYQWIEHPVIQVNSVDSLTGAILTFTTLSGGCANFGVDTAPSMDSLSVVGTGATFQVSGPYYAPSVFNEYYDYPTPPADLSTALQYANYQLYQVLIHGVAFTTLHLEPPALSMQLGFYGSKLFLNALHINMYEFQPPVENLASLGTADYVFPLTQRNVDAIDFQDRSNCWYRATNNCYLNLDLTRKNNLIAMQFKTYAQQFGIKLHSWIRFRINSFEEEPFLDANMTLHYPFMLVLPSL
jgi:hypothetical protein